MTRFYLWPADGSWHIQEIGGLGMFGSFSSEAQARSFVAAVQDISRVQFVMQKPKAAA